MASGGGSGAPSKYYYDTEDQTSTNSYVTMTIHNISHYNSVLLWFSVATNDIKYKIDGSTDGSTFEEIKAETVLASGSTDYETLINEAWRFVRMQIASNVGGAHGVMTLDVVAK